MSDFDKYMFDTPRKNYGPEDVLNRIRERVFRVIAGQTEVRKLSIQNATLIDADVGESIGVTEAPTEASDDDDGGDDDGEDDWRRRPRKHPSNAHAAHPRGIARTGTRNAAKNPQVEIDDSLQLWRLPTVLEHIPVSKSGWFAGVKAGIYPAPLRIGPRAVAWRARDIRAFVESLTA